MTINTKLVLFDFDGVIADSFEPVASGIIRIASKYGLPVKTPQDVRDLYNNNFYESVKKLGMTEESLSSFMNDTFWEAVSEKVQPARGMEELIPTLASKFPLVIITSADTAWASAFLKRYHLDIFFEKVLGKEAGLGKVEKIQQCLIEYGAPKNTVFYIGDTTGDIEEARNAGVRTIAVTWGFHSKEKLQELHPDYIVDSADKLKRIFL